MAWPRTGILMALAWFGMVLCVLFIVYWTAAELPLPTAVVVKTGVSSATHTVKPPQGGFPQAGAPPGNTAASFLYVLGHPVVLNYAMKIYYSSLEIMLISALPLLGSAFAVYIEAKLGLYVNYVAGAHLPHLLLIGYLVTQPSFWLELAGFALASSSTLRLVGDRSHPLRERLIWIPLALGLSCTMLFVAAVLETGAILSVH